MLAAVRREKITDIILEKKSVSVVSLSEKFGVSEETIRRDLKTLEEQGILEKTYGGAVLANRVLSNVSNDVLEKIFVDSKNKIADIAKRLIKNGDCIFMDASTTSYVLCEAISDMKITILTNSVKIINKMCDCPNVNVICIGGHLSKKRESFTGRIANQILEKYYVDKAFISCRSVSMDFGITDSDDEDAQIKNTICKRANKVYLIADHSKFSKISFSQICGFSDLDYIITDEPLNEDWISFIEDKKIVYLDSTVNMDNFTNKEE